MGRRISAAAGHPTFLEFSMQRLILAVTFAVTIGAIMMSGPLGASHQIPTKAYPAASIDTASLPLAVTSLPVAQVDQAF
jgi:hypothetical protein